ncbi:MAG: ABC transporter ATP-binding protein [Porticoccaceae bacterium]|uniref:ABC transporter ATP-binding protein n=1 Tax=Thalassospira sp. TaxID=1912094 RepID=UPI003A89E7D6
MLKVKDLSVNFGGVKALQNVSFEVQPQEVLGLVGPNGAGKTTSFNVLSGVITPTSGEVTYNDEDILKSSMHQRVKHGIGRTFQIPQPMHELTVRENLIVAQRFGREDGKVDHARIDEILTSVNLLHKSENDAANELALTERKALEVAKALATEPTLLMLDEVLAGLETTSKKLFMQTLKNIHRTYALSMIVIEHDIETIMNLCDRVVVFNFGQVIAEGEPEETFRNPEVVRSYTGEAHS